MMLKNYFIIAVLISFSFSFFHYYEHNLEILTLSNLSADILAVHANAPNAKRDESVKYYLIPSVRLFTGHSYGSGTICYYDTEKNIAYIVSCAHLWGETPNKSPKDNSEATCQVDIFYKNEKKLEKPQRFQAEVICFNHTSDVSFIKFTPDWKIDHYMPIAPLTYQIENNYKFESVGCDEASEVAAYTVKIYDKLYLVYGDIMTIENSPRLGRSGGGLVTSDGYIIGICRATSNVDGSGYGFFVPLSKVYKYAENHAEVSWLLRIIRQTSFSQQIPMIDENGSIYIILNGYLPEP